MIVACGTAYHALVSVEDRYVIETNGAALPVEAGHRERVDLPQTPVIDEDTLVIGISAVGMPRDTRHDPGR